MSAKPFHLGWFVSRGYGPKAWRHPWAGPRDAVAAWTRPDMIVDLARAMERAKFDYIMLEDSSNIPYTYGNSHDAYLRNAVDSPKLDPAVLVPYIAQATSTMGIVLTASTTEYPPFLLARLFNTLDHLTGGRVGWNVVTGSNDGGAQNYGMERQYRHDTRYDMADEYLDLVFQLWDSWEPDAMMLDEDAGVFADPAKVHPIHFEGKYFKSRGPLSAPRSPQGHPAICQAGGSPRGREFASRWSDTILTTSTSVEKMRETREDVRQRIAAHGRDPDDVKQLFLVWPTIAETDEAARQRKEEEAAVGRRFLETGLASMSRLTGVDFAKFDLDEPIPEFDSNGHRTVAARYVGHTPREIAERPQDVDGLDFTGTPDRVAGMMDEVMEEVGGDGFLIAHSHFSRRYVAEITDGLVPELQKRGLTRAEYSPGCLRDHLREF